MLYLSFKNNLMFMAFVFLMGVSQLAFAMDAQKVDEKQTVSRKRYFDRAEDAPYPESMKRLLERLANDTREDISWLESRVRDHSPKQRESEINYYFAMKREEGNYDIALSYHLDFLIASREY